MTKPTKPAYELSDADKRDLIQLIQAGKPLPEKYRFVLFEDKREVELVWNGKSADVCTAVLPFQTLEHVDEPREETKSQGQLFDARGRQTQGWTNKLIWGDNKLILSSLKAGALRRQIEDAGGLKLIYIDPPFDVGADFSMDIEIGGEQRGFRTTRTRADFHDGIARVGGFWRHDAELQLQGELFLRRLEPDDLFLGHDAHLGIGKFALEQRSVLREISLRLQETFARCDEVLEPRVFLGEFLRALWIVKDRRLAE